MTIPEASSLVLQTGGVGSESSLYILDMGNPLNITDLAKQLITFHGFTPEKEIPIKYIGLRPGEKLTERLWSDDECPRKTRYPYINRVERKELFNGELDQLIERLRTICFFDEQQPALYRNRRELRKLLSSYIPAVSESEHEPEY
jgi:FlaA1/EpsC-like NDP-sugar epimerase